MKIVTLAQIKGGVGKSSVSINLACQAVAHGKSAVILDMDTEQGSVRKWRERRGKRIGLEEPQVFSVGPPELEKKIAELKARGIDWVFIDTPGRTSYGRGMVIADMVLIPSRPVEDDIEPSLAMAAKIRQSGRRNYAYLMNICPPQVEKAGSSRSRKIAEALKKAGHPVSPVIVIQRIAVPDANTRGLGVNEYEPGSQSAAEYSDLFEWMESELK